MDVLLLAAGRGTRLAPITDHLPKCLVRISGRPLLEYWLEPLTQFKQTRDIFLNLNYLADHVNAYLLNSPFRKRVSSLPEATLLGTGGTLVRLLKDRGPFQDDLLVAHADNFSLFSLDSFLKRHKSRPRECLATVLTFLSDTPKNCGILEIDDNGVVQFFHEKVENPPGRVASGAVFLFSPEALRLIACFGDRDFSSTTPDGIFDLSRDFIPNMSGRLYTFNEVLYHRDIGTLQSLAQAREDARKLLIEGI
jgi:mannose-1-phosphate guanylyltransferase